jgi:hypothetical protein
MRPQRLDIGGKAALQRPLRLKAERTSRLVDREGALQIDSGTGPVPDRDFRFRLQPARDVRGIG